MSMCSGLLPPYRASSTRPATIVGSANGRSISVSTMDLPGKLSRTSTQATTVPSTTLTTATTADAPSVSTSADHESGVRTAAQNAPGPPAPACQTTAASGISTMRLRYNTAVPSPRPVRARGRASVNSTVDNYLAVGLALVLGVTDVATPRPCSIEAMTLTIGSNRSLFTFDHPPRSAMV